jgi:FkbM family methyltransferase
MRSSAGRAFRALRYRRLKRRLAGPRLIAAFADVRPDATFVEIGSNDGVQHDHLRPFIVERQWRGVMVEPVPYVFERLRRNYGEIERVQLENAAIADRDGFLPFYYLRPPAPDERDELPSWYDGIGSFSRDVVASHATHIADIDGRIVETEVPALTFASLCRKHGLERVDLVLVDAEGYDHRIVRSIDLAAWHPALLVYEHYHLDPGEQRACTAFVHDQGYETMEEGFDTWCLDPAADARLAAVWRGLRPAVPAAFASEGRR